MHICIVQCIELDFRSKRYIKIDIIIIISGLTENTYLNDDKKTDASTHVGRVTVHARHHVDYRLTHGDDHAKHYNIDSHTLHMAVTLAHSISD